MDLTKHVSEIVEKSKNPLLGKHDSWKRVNLGDIATIQNGFAFKSELFSKDNGMPLIRIRDVGKDNTDTNYVGEYDPEYIVESGDLLIGMDGDFNCARWHGPRALLNQRVCRIKVTSDIYHPKLLEYALPGYLKAINDFTSSVTVKHLSSRSIAEIPLPFPPMEQQNRLVAEIEKQFSRLDEAVAGLKRAQANLKRYKSAVLKSAVEGKLTEQWRKEHPDVEPASKLLERILAERRAKWNGRGKYKEPAAPDTTEFPELPQGWVWATVEQLASKVQYGHTASAVERSSGVRFLRITDIQEGHVDWSSVPSCDISKEDKHELLLLPGDIVFARTGATVGKSFLLKTPFPESVFASYLIRISAIEPTFGNWLFAFFQSPGYWTQIRESQAGIGQPNVNGAKLQSLKVPLPPLIEQQRIVAEAERRLSMVEELEKEVTANLQRAECLRQAVLQRAFAGDI